MGNPSSSRHSSTPATAAPHTLEAFRPLLDAELNSLMADRVQAAGDIDPLYGRLVQTMGNFIAHGGKRLRPYLTYLGFVGSGGDPENRALIRLAAAQELYHNAWLIHDDIIDRDTIRYAGPNIAGTYESRFAEQGLADGPHLAQAMALIAGDINISIATDLILASSFPAELKVAAARRAQQLNFELAGGEMLDVLMPTLKESEATAERLMSVCHYKTASYSFEAPLQIGAILAGAEPARLAAISVFAIPLGIAFQVADDLLGTFGSEAELGKPVLSDLREGKRTLLLLAGLRLASPADRQRLQTVYGDRSAGYRHLSEARDILERCGARAETEALAQAQVTKALAALGTLDFSAGVRTELEKLAQFTIKRRS